MEVPGCKPRLVPRDSWGSSCGTDAAEDRSHPTGRLWVPWSVWSRQWCLQLHNNDNPARQREATRQVNGDGGCGKGLQLRLERCYGRRREREGRGERQLETTRTKWGRGETDVCTTPPQLPHTRHKQRCCTQLQNRSMTALTQCHAGTAGRCCPSPGGNPGGLASHGSCRFLRPALHGVHLGRELGVAVDGHLIKQYTQARSTTQLMPQQRSLLPTRHTYMQRPGWSTPSPHPHPHPHPTPCVQTPTSAAHRRKDAQNVFARYDSSSSRFSASLRKGTTDCRICNQGKTRTTRSRLSAHNW
jgi:hypothetical protein